MTWEEFCEGMHEEPPEEWHGAFERLSHKEVIALTFAARIAQTEVSLKAFADELVKRMELKTRYVNTLSDIEIIQPSLKSIINELLTEAGVQK